MDGQIGGDAGVKVHDWKGRQNCTGKKKRKEMQGARGQVR